MKQGSHGHALKKGGYLIRGAANRRQPNRIRFILSGGSHDKTAVELYGLSGDSLGMLLERGGNWVKGHVPPMKLEAQ